MFIVYHGFVSRGFVSYVMTKSKLVAKGLCYLFLACGEEVYFLEV